MDVSKRIEFIIENLEKVNTLADIGTDHGYVPLIALERELCTKAIACDINKGPLDSCIQLVADYSFEDKIKCVLSDGLCNIAENECDDIAICGMGGELIAQILDNCTWAKNSSKHFILNPMTHPEILRKYLCDNGFEIQNDIIVKEGRHCYSVFDAYYTGNIFNCDKSYYYLGNIKNFENKDYFNHLLNYLENKSGEDFSDVISAIKEKL